MEILTLNKLEELLKGVEENDRVKNKLIGDYTVYFHYLKYFENKNEITEHDFYISTGFVYSWMPTMLKKASYSENIGSILNQVLLGHDLDINQLKELASHVNNSLVV